MEVTETNGKSRAGTIFFVVSLALVVFGLVAIFHPVVTGIATGVIVATTLVFAGLSSLWAGISGDGPLGRTSSVLFGVLALVTGVFLLFFPLEGAVSLVWLIGVSFVATGILDLIDAARHSKLRFVRIVIGLFNLAIGIYVLTLLQAQALQLLALLIGLGLIARAVLLALLAWSVRKIASAT